MERIVFLFPEKDSLPEAYCSSLLCGEKDIPLMDRVDMIDTFLNVHKTATYTSSNYRGHYFEDNVGAFLAPFNNSGYPKPITRLKAKFKASYISSASGVLAKPTTTNNSVFGAPSISEDYLVKVAFHSITSTDSIACVVPSWICGKKVPVKCDTSVNNVELLSAQSKTVWEWISSNHSPRRVFESNPKHAFAHSGKGGVPIAKWPYNKSNSQEFLDKAIPQGHRLVFYDGASYLVFNCHDKVANLYHAYPDEHFAIENEVRKTLRVLGVIP